MLWTGLLVGLKVFGASTSSWLVVVLAIAVGGIFAWRMTVLGVDVNDEQLIVRNFLRTRVIDRRRLDGFRIGRSPTMPFGGTCVLALTKGGGIVALMITARATRFTGSRRVDDDLATVRTWLAGG